MKYKTAEVTVVAIRSRSERFCVVFQSRPSGEGRGEGGEPFYCFTLWCPSGNAKAEGAFQMLRGKEFSRLK